jgi:hypothetical protein
MSCNPEKPGSTMIRARPLELVAPSLSRPSTGVRVPKVIDVDAGPGPAFGSQNPQFNVLQTILRALPKLVVEIRQTSSTKIIVPAPDRQDPILSKLFALGIRGVILKDKPPRYVLPPLSLPSCGRMHISSTLNSTMK